MQYAHGSFHHFYLRSSTLTTHTGLSTSGVPFSPPLAFRTINNDSVSKHEKARLEQGRCHKCKKWVNIEGVKDVEVKVRIALFLPHTNSSSGLDGGQEIPHSNEWDPKLPFRLYAEALVRRTIQEHLKYLSACGILEFSRLIVAPVTSRTSAHKADKENVVG